MNYMLLILISLGFQVVIPKQITIIPNVEEPIPIQVEIVQDIIEPKIVEPVEIKKYDDVIQTDYGYYKRYNNIDKCWDESEKPIFETVHKIMDGYDPDWLECVNDKGCVFCFHPNQGHGNSAPDTKN